MNIGEWLASVADLPRRDCEHLLSAVTRTSHAQILAFPETAIAALHQARLQDAVADLRAGIPLAYVLGREGFWNLELEVTPAVLVPRPETELLVELTLALAPQQARVLDLGTGSGAIAVAVAHARPDLKVTALDRSTAALEVAQRNARRYQADIEFVVSNWCAALTGQWQIVVSNPPYIAADDPHLPALNHEPRNALVAGHQGLDDLQQIINQSPEHLCRGGYLILEHGYNQAPLVRQMLITAGFEAVRTVKDLADIERATLGCWGKEPQQTQ